MWALGAADSAVRLAGAVLTLGVFPHDQSRMGPDVTVWPWAGPLVACPLMRYPGPPWMDKSLGALAFGEAIDGGVRMSSDALTAHLERSFREGDTCAFFPNASSRAAFRAPWSPFHPTQLRLVVYRRGAGGSRAVAAPATPGPRPAGVVAPRGRPAAIPSSRRGSGALAPAPATVSHRAD